MGCLPTLIEHPYSHEVTFHPKSHRISSGNRMQASFGKTVSTIEKVQRLEAVAGSGDSLAILLNADPDAMASALALKRIFWRRVQPIQIFRINRIDRADNIAFVKLLDIQQRYIREFKKSHFSNLL